MSSKGWIYLLLAAIVGGLGFAIGSDAWKRFEEKHFAGTLQNNGAAKQ